MEFKVNAYNKRGYLQEEVFTSYIQALHWVIECKNSDQYKVITILKYDPLNQQYFLNRIIK